MPAKCDAGLREIALMGARQVGAVGAEGENRPLLGQMRQSNTDK